MPKKKLSFEELMDFCRDAEVPEDISLPVDFDEEDYISIWINDRKKEEEKEIKKKINGIKYGEEYKISISASNKRAVVLFGALENGWDIAKTNEALRNCGLNDIYPCMPYESCIYYCLSKFPGENNIVRYSELKSKVDETLKDITVKTPEAILTDGNITINSLKKDIESNSIEISTALFKRKTVTNTIMRGISSCESEGDFLKVIDSKIRANVTNINRVQRYYLCVFLNYCLCARVHEIVEVMNSYKDRNDCWKEFFSGLGEEEGFYGEMFGEKSRYYSNDKKYTFRYLLFDKAEEIRSDYGSLEEGMARDRALFVNRVIRAALGKSFFENVPSERCGEYTMDDFTDLNISMADISTLFYMRTNENDARYLRNALSSLCTISRTSFLWFLLSCAVLLDSVELPEDIKIVINEGHRIAKCAPEVRIENINRILTECHMEKLNSEKLVDEIVLHVMKSENMPECYNNTVRGYEPFTRMVSIKNTVSNPPEERLDNEIARYKYERE